DGVPRSKRINVYRLSLDWARSDPSGLRAAAKSIAAGRTRETGAARKLLAIIQRHDPLDPPGEHASDRLLRGRPQALAEAVEILIARGDDVITVLTRYPYTDPDTIGGYLDLRLSPSN